MKRYFINLTRALFGTDPFRAELEELRGRYDQAASNVEALRNMYLTCEELLNGAERRMAEMESDFDKERRSYQTLTENLRGRIADHEAQRDEYEKEIGSLRQQILAAMRDNVENDNKEDI